MSHRRGTRREQRGTPRRWLLLALLVPAFVLGPLLRGATAWIHSHGDGGAHVHFLPRGILHGDRIRMDAWHAADHRHEHRHGHGHGHDDAPGEDAVPAPEGLLLELLQPLAVGAKDSARCGAASVPPPALLSAFVRPAAAVQAERPNDPCRSGWPPGPSERTGIAALLCSSHALLI